ncbi:MAG: T9SS type A sorting domain-containing protein [Candidatus Krumholzibacteria bacterium]|nr:T9SS type A sorting domain-containing protein [Candidatus Krumholzibacteria bacterium]
MRRDITLIIAVLMITPAGAGVLRAGWEEGGIPVCQYETGTGRFQTITDGAKGLIIIWRDTRSDAGDIYAQRVGPYGDVKWGIDGMPVCALKGAQGEQHALADGEGGFFLSWTDQQVSWMWKVYVQRVNAERESLWGTAGREVCPTSTYQIRSRLVSDGEGGIYVIWEDRRMDTAIIRAQRFDGDGERMWQEDGVVLSPEPISAGIFSFHPDEEGGATAVWVTSHNIDGWKICAQHVAPDGSLPWGEEKTIVYDPNSYVGYAACMAPGGGTYIAWFSIDQFHIWSRIYCQKIGNDGEPAWREGGVKADSLHTNQGGLRIMPAGSDDLLIVWQAHHSAGTYWQCAQKIDRYGLALWGVSGTHVAYTAHCQSGLDVATDGAEGAYTLWYETRDLDQSDIYAQHFDNYGVYRWDLTGLRITTDLSNQSSPDLVADSRGGAFMLWLDSRSGIDIYGLRIDSRGEPVAGTTLLDYSARPDGRDIVVEWRLEEVSREAVFSIFRATGTDTAFFEIESPRIERSGLSYTFRDRGAEPSTTYRYRVDVTDEEAGRILFVTDAVTTPGQTMTLYQNYPNPFDGATEIRFYLPSPGLVKLGIYDPAGRLVINLFRGWKETGHHIVTWDGHGPAGEPFPSGLYFARLECGGDSRGKKVILLGR